MASKSIFKDAESVEFSGKGIVKLAEDPGRIKKTGKIVLVSDLAREYNFTDDDGDIHDMRSIKNLLKTRGYGALSNGVPGFLRLPLVLMHYGSNKF